MDKRSKVIDLDNDTPISEAPYADLHKVGFFDYKEAKPELFTEQYLN